MDNAALNFGLREYCMDGISKACKAIHGDDHDVFYTTIFNLIENSKPVFCALISPNPHSQNFP